MAKHQYLKMIQNIYKNADFSQQPVTSLLLSSIKKFDLDKPTELWMEDLLAVKKTINAGMIAQLLS